MVEIRKYYNMKNILLKLETFQETEHIFFFIMVEAIKLHISGLKLLKSLIETKIVTKTEF